MTLKSLAVDATVLMVGAALGYAVTYAVYAVYVVATWVIR